jgi:hypothetical protein
VRGGKRRCAELSNNTSRDFGGDGGKTFGKDFPPEHFPLPPNVKAIPSNSHISGKTTDLTKVTFLTCKKTLNIFTYPAKEHCFLIWLFCSRNSDRIGRDRTDFCTLHELWGHPWTTGGLGPHLFSAEFGFERIFFFEKTKTFSFDGGTQSKSKNMTE